MVYGQPLLCHSSTTYLPRNWSRLSVLPCESVAVKLGAGAPTFGACAATGSVIAATSAAPVTMEAIRNAIESTLLDDLLRRWTQFYPEPYSPLDDCALS